MTRITCGKCHSDMIKDSTKQIGWSCPKCSPRTDESIYELDVGLRRIKENESVRKTGL